jgi:hypothetical protein
LRDDTWRKERNSNILELWEFCGEVLGAVKKILAIDWERIRGNGSRSTKTWHSGRVESVESLKLQNPGDLKLLLTINLNPRTILNHTILDIVFLT